MKNWFNRVITEQNWLRTQPWVLFGLTVVSYGLLIPWLGYFWDDFPVAWIADRLGHDGLERYFFNNRPMLSWLYQITVSLFGTQVPWHWHVFALVTRFGTALALYSLVRAIWEKYAHLAVWASLFFLVYPGFKQQWVSIIYGHFFLILTGLLASFYLSVKVARLCSSSSGVGLAGNWKAWFFAVIAWLLAFQNLLFLDYFFFLEPVRFALLWEALREQLPERKERFRKVIGVWLPFLALWAGFVIYRLATLQSQPHHYQIMLFERLRDVPLEALLTLAGNILRSLWIAIPVAWGGIFQLPEGTLGVHTTLMAVVLTGAILLILVGYLWVLKRKLAIETDARKVAFGFIGMGLVACLTAGWAIWLPGLEIGTRFATDRFSLVFLPGAALIWAGIIGLLPARHPFPWLAVALFTSLAAGQQFVVANAFRKDWELQQRFFWQLTWRVPTLERGTLILSDELPFTFYTDNSLTAPLNWFYAIDNTTTRMSYLLFYPAIRLGTSLPGLTPGLPVRVDYLAAIFEGNTSHVLGLVYEPPACLRILEPDLDVENKMLPAVMQYTATLSSKELILPSAIGREVTLPSQLYGSEPEHRWCYYFEKADLARQQEDWALVAALGDQAFVTGDYPNDPMERLPFIEGYAHVENWDRALELSRQSQQITPKMVPGLCNLWDRISRSTPDSPEKNQTIQTAINELRCVQR